MAAQERQEDRPVTLKRGDGDGIFLCIRESEGSSLARRHHFPHAELSRVLTNPVHVVTARVGGATGHVVDRRAINALPKAVVIRLDHGRRVFARQQSDPGGWNRKARASEKETTVGCGAVHAVDTGCVDSWKPTGQHGGELIAVGTAHAARCIIPAATVCGGCRVAIVRGKLRAVSFANRLGHERGAKFGIGGKIDHRRPRRRPRRPQSTRIDRIPRLGVE